MCWLQFFLVYCVVSLLSVFPFLKKVLDVILFNFMTNDLDFVSRNRVSLSEIPASPRHLFFAFN